MTGLTMSASPGSGRQPVAAIVWRQPDGQPVSCTEKIKVLNENLEEIRQLCQDAFEDGLLMGCDERQLRDALTDIARALVNPYPRAGNSPAPVVAADIDAQPSDTDDTDP